MPDLKADFPEYTEVHSQVLQDVLLRLEQAFQAFFRRLKVGEQPGYPRFQGRAAIPASPLHSMATVRCWMALFSACRRLGVYPSPASAPCRHPEDGRHLAGSGW